MVVIGLTGGTATGKSTVADILRDLGAKIIDADVLARELVKPESRSGALKQIREHFGESVINEDGSLNRRALGRICFSSRERLLELNEIMHPRIKESVKMHIESYRNMDNPPMAVVIDAAILIESSMSQLVDVVIVTDAPRELQISRLMRRSGLTEQEAKERVMAQRTSDRFKEYADYVIDTSKGVESYRVIIKGIFDDIVKRFGGRP